MTPKEKAKELIEKYSPLVTTWDCYNDTPTEDEYILRDAKKCAEIAIKSEYHSLREMLFNLKACRIIENDNVYLYRLYKLIEEEKLLIQELELL